MTMLVRRWIAPLKPNKDQIKAFFEREELNYFEESFEPGAFIASHRHPF